MTELKFTKMHGIGNDFIVIEDKDLKKNNIKLTRDLVQKMCHRNFGIGSDGIVVIEKGKEIDFKYRMYNPDGSEAEMCGNGIRCYMKYLTQNNLSQENNIDVETGIGILNLDIQENIVTVDMGKPNQIKNLKIKSDNKEFDIITVSMGNPHAVIFLNNGVLKDFNLQKYGKPIENNLRVFPNRTNVEFIEFVSNKEINMRVWERGATETLACGTGACASVVAGMIEGKLEKNKFIKVNLKGGILEIKWSGNNEDSVIMKGPAETSFEGIYYIK